MSMLVLGLALFLGVHSVSIVSHPTRDGWVSRIGEGPWKGLYSLASAVGLVLIVLGYAAARNVPTVLYVPPYEMRHATLTLLLPVFVLLFAAYLPGRIRAAVGHPMLAATILWSVGHLLINGMLHDVLLFGSLLVWAVFDWISVGRRPARPVPTAPPSPWNDAIAVVGGVGTYLVTLFWLHEALIGIAPLG